MDILGPLFGFLYIIKKIAFAIFKTILHFFTHLPWFIKYPGIALFLLSAIYIMYYIYKNKEEYTEVEY